MFIIKRLPALPEMEQSMPFHVRLKLLWMFLSLSKALISFGFRYAVEPEITEVSWALFVAFPV